MFSEVNALYIYIYTQDKANDHKQPIMDMDVRFKDKIEVVVICVAVIQHWGQWWNILVSEWVKNIAIPFK